MADPREAVQVLDVLVAEDLEERVRRHDPEQAVRPVDDRDGREAMRNRARGGVLLVRLREDRRRRHGRQIAQLRVSRRAEQDRKRNETHQVTVFGDQVDRLRAIEVVAEQPLTRGRGGVRGRRGRDAADEVLAGGLAGAHPGFEREAGVHGRLRYVAGGV